VLPSVPYLRHTRVSSLAARARPYRLQCRSYPYGGEYSAPSEKGDSYAPSLTRFLNQFSRKCKGNTEEQNEYLESLFVSFLNACRDLDDEAFINRRNRRFNLALFEAVFAAVSDNSFKNRKLIEGTLDEAKIRMLDNDQAFLEASLKATTQTANVRTRLQRAREIVGSL